MILSKVEQNQTNKMSIAIPYHGGADLFRETLERLCSQSQKCFECVISDDSDNEQDIEDLKHLSEEFSQKGLNIKTVRTSPNLGAIANTKQAIDNCSCDIIRILHTDDALAPGTIKFELEIFEKCPDTFFAFHNASVFREKFIPNEHGQWSNITWLENWLRNKNYTHSILPSCLILRKEVLETVGFFNPDYEFMYDWEYQIRLFEYALRNNKTVVEIPAGYVGWRYSNTSESYKKSLKCWSDSRKILKLLDAHAKRISDTIPYNKKRIASFKKGVDNRLVWEYENLDTKFKLPLCFKVKRIVNKIQKMFFSKWKDDDYRHYVFCGLKINTTRKEKKRLMNVRNFLGRVKVPFTINNNFVYYTNRPIYAKDFSKKCSGSSSLKIGIVMQGPIVSQHNFTIETIKMYKNMFEGQDVEIILSCWSDENSSLIKKCKKLGVTVVKSDKITYSGRANLNYQIISSREGIKKAEELGCKYVLKTRTDQRFYKTDVFEFFLNMLEQYPLQGHSLLKKRIIACSFNSFIYRLYGVSDMFLFGTVEDMIKYWDIPFDNQSPEEWQNCSGLELFKSYCSETYITRAFLKNAGHIVKDNITDSLNVYANYFIFVDKEQLMLYWPKYSNKNSRWDFFYPHALEEIKFIDWLNLYFDRTKIDYYKKQEWKELPPF